MRKNWLHTQPTFAFIGLLMGFSLAVTLPAYVMDDRLFEGVNVWLKPVKFQIALCLYFLSLAFFAQWAPQSLLSSPKFRLYAIIVVIMTALEMIWISSGAVLAIPSHYNDQNLIMAVIYPVMGVFAVTLTSASFVLGLAILRNKDSGLDPALRLSIATGLMLTCILTVIAAGTLSAQTSHYIGTPVTNAAIPLLGWSQEVGDLRVAHFFATHAMHVLPAIGLISLALPRAALRMWVVRGAAIVFTGFVTLLFVQALMGLPFIPTTSII